MHADSTGPLRAINAILFTKYMLTLLEIDIDNNGLSQQTLTCKKRYLATDMLITTNYDLDDVYANY